MIIGIESLDGMFGQVNNASHCTYEGKCHNCGCDAQVEITKTSGGYGLQGGVLCETNPQKLLILCSVCYEKFGKPIDLHRCSASKAGVSSSSATRRKANPSSHTSATAPESFSNIGLR
jgi:hypothetical protein